MNEVPIGRAQRQALDQVGATVRVRVLRPRGFAVASWLHASGTSVVEILDNDGRHGDRVGSGEDRVCSGGAWGRLLFLFVCACPLASFKGRLESDFGTGSVTGGGGSAVVEK